MAELTKPFKMIGTTLKKGWKVGDRIKHDGWSGSIARDKHKAYLDQWGPIPKDLKKKN